MRTFQIFLALTLFISSFSFAADTATPTKNTLPKAATANSNEYDRLDGRGASGKRVDVIEWESNLEIHVYPKNSLVGLALKLDTSDKSKNVMVIGYRFNNDPKKQLIRRALVSIPFTAKFSAYLAKNEPDFDKIVISNNGLSGDLAEYKLDPEPTQLYPDGGGEKKKTAEEENKTLVDPISGKRFPSSQIQAAPPATVEEGGDPAPADANPNEVTKSGVRPSKPKTADDEGTIKPFQW